MCGVHYLENCLKYGPSGSGVVCRANRQREVSIFYKHSLLAFN